MTSTGCADDALFVASSRSQSPISVDLKATDKARIEHAMHPGELPFERVGYPVVAGCRLRQSSGYVTDDIAPQADDWKREREDAAHTASCRGD